MNALRLIAGKTARARIKQDGLTPEMIKMVLGASGGPKWLVLLGLDKFVFGHWLHTSTHKIDLIGSSIGAWRMASAAHPNALKTIETFIGLYMQFRSEHAANAEVLTTASYSFLHKLYSPAEATRLVINPLRNLNIVTARVKGLRENSSRFKEAGSIIVSAAANSLRRDHLAKFYERVVFYSGEHEACPEAWSGFSQSNVKLSGDILADVLMASGSIPFVGEPVINIEGAPKGVYRDGGIIDYHFDTPWNIDDGIILYPHFYPYLIPGWFDKRIKSRVVKGAVWDNILLLAPSEAFIQALPKGKIPDRNDFISMNDAERLNYWAAVTKESERLAEEFADCLEEPDKLYARLEIAPA
ncbi:patatin-like phospholipase family protein [Kordiimonas pumila]|uniref:Patatin-like phospholipase family protein n=1 Tax=Kordiimonas pumila TaxID=2161677 RepID=A0ABV7D1W5_9PROT|nr:patatin-like phospholipase family protein [Kordiimonas pumila]